MHSSINCPWLKDGVTTEIFGQKEPSGIVEGFPFLEIFQGQPSNSFSGLGKINFSLTMITNCHNYF
jgi:hypothetical protein